MYKYSTQSQAAFQRFLKRQKKMSNKVMGQEREMKDYPNKPGDLREYDISDEEWREYDFGGRTYRIDKPVKLFLRVGGTTHRVVDSEGVVHCAPTVGQDGCVLRWKNFDTDEPVQF